MDVVSRSTPETVPRQEPRDVRWMRWVLRRWFLPRGKGLLMRLFQSRLRQRDFLMEVEPGIFIPAALDDYIVYWVFVHGYDSDPSVRLSRRLIRAGDTVVDVGANIGLWVMGAAVRAGEDGDVHAIEPMPDNGARLRAHLRLNGLERVRCEQVALSDRCGVGTIFQPSYGNSGHASLAQREGVDIPIETRTTTLDAYCDEHAIRRIDFLKVDVEGAELLVFRGAERVLSSPDAPAILFEVNDETAAQLGSSSVAVKSLLSQHGYALFRCDGKKLRAAEIDQPEPPGDLFAFKPHHFEHHPVLRDSSPRSE